MTHGSSGGVADAFKAVAKLLVRAEDDAAVVGVSNRDISRQSASTSSLLNPPYICSRGRSIKCGSSRINCRSMMGSRSKSSTCATPMTSGRTTMKLPTSLSSMS
jgi:hypothetical protein